MRPPEAPPTRPELKGTLGMVAATHWLAAQSGMAMLERGGNAFDAAVAAGFVLEVVEPHQCGPGGEVPVVAYSARERAAFVVDGQGPAPCTATPERMRSLGLDRIPGTGLLPACVPGALGAFLLLLDRYGTMSLREVLEPAIAYAERGFPVVASLSSVLADVAPFMVEHWPSSAEQWLGGGVPVAGSRATNRPLAATYRRLLGEAESGDGARSHQLERARRAVYEGFVAEAIDRFASSEVADEVGVHAGLLSGEDLAGWRASIEEPARFSYRGLEICKTGPWGQGPVLLQQLALLSGFDLADLAGDPAALVHVVTECAKLAFADREAYYGDPRFVEVPLAELLSPGYNDGRRRLVAATASSELRPGSPGGRSPRLPALLAGLAAEAGSVDSGAVPVSGIGGIGRRDTIHLDVADRFGNLVSATPSGGWLQGSPAVPGLGFPLGTRAQMLWLEEGLAASLAPGKRPRTTLSPSLALRDGDPFLAFGTPGGDQQDQWPLLFLIFHVDLGYPMQAAIDAVTWHTTHAPSSFYPRHAHPGEVVVETSLGREALAALAARGHRLVEAAPWTLGRVTAVERQADGMLAAAADRRGAQAYAVGR